MPNVENLKKQAKQFRSSGFLNRKGCLSACPDREAPLQWVARDTAKGRAESQHF